MQASVFVYKCMHGCFHAGICVCNIYMCVCVCVCVCVFPFVAIELNCVVT